MKKISRCASLFERSSAISDSTCEKIFIRSARLIEEAMINYPKIIRVSAWLLVITALLTLLSGFFLSKSFLFPWADYGISRYFHTVLLPIIFIPLFYAHSLAGILFLFCRHPSINKKPFRAAACFAWTGVFALLVFFLAAQNPVAQPSSAESAISPTGAFALGAENFSASEIAKHSAAKDCWIVISGKVYNATAYLDFHPGKPETIVPYCGQNATSAFFGKPHSQYALGILSSFYIGDFAGSGGSMQENKSLPIMLNPAQNITANTTRPSFLGTILTASEIIKHNTAGDCWLVISGKVYDVTSYLGVHPGNPETITPYCGLDATFAFEGKPHSQYAVSLLGSYYIGDIGGQRSAINITRNPERNISFSPPQNTSNSTTPALPPAGNSISLSELAGHNSQADCWIAISNKVYDVTAYISLHPGGAAAIVSYCGSDATAAFGAQGHSSYAYSLLASYYKGYLASTAPPPANNTNNTTPAPNASLPVPPNASSSAPNATRLFNFSEISLHSSASDCWLVIWNGVYNVTSYLPFHPGGAGAISPYCGRNATAAFAAQSHSQNAYSLLGSYYIGNVSGQANQTAPQPAPQPAPPREYDGDD